ncbi:MAG TPA: hypothetical protein VEI97_19440 [bacterium]|nr:hypothetical protein [bacterium]
MALALMLAGCASGDGGLARVRTTEADRLRLATLAALPRVLDPQTQLPDLASLRQDPGLEVALQEFTHHYASPAQAQLAYLRYWSDRRLESDIAAADLLRGTLPLALMEPPDVSQALALIQGDPDAIFTLDLPFDQPDPGALALVFRGDPPQLAKLLSPPFAGFEELQLQITDEAIALLLARGEGDAGLPMALHALEVPLPSQLAALQGAWLAWALAEVSRTPDANGVLNPPATTFEFSRPTESGNFPQLLALFEAVPKTGSAAQHEGLRATAALWCQGWVWTLARAPDRAPAAAEALGLLQRLFGTALTPAEAGGTDLAAPLQELEAAIAAVAPAPSVEMAP